jgi:hypothetical protein
MKLVLVSAAMAATAIPAMPALAHCGTVHHRVHHAAWHAPVRHHAVHYAAGCGCATRVAYRPGRIAYRPAVYPVAYPRPRIVEVTYERPRPFYRPLYRPYRLGYAVPLYRPRPAFYGGRFERPFHRRWAEGGYHGRWAENRSYGRHERWGGWR